MLPQPGQHRSREGFTLRLAVGGERRHRARVQMDDAKVLQVGATRRAASETQCVESDHDRYG
jgi:hypothetical protein